LVPHSVQNLPSILPPQVGQDQADATLRHMSSAIINAVSFFIKYNASLVSIGSIVPRMCGLRQ
jgi:hypothetical protein